MVEYSGDESSCDCGVVLGGVVMVESCNGACVELSRVEYS